MLARKLMVCSALGGALLATSAGAQIPTTSQPAAEKGSAEKGSGTFCAKHPSGRSGKRFLTPFPPPATPTSRPAYNPLTSTTLTGDWGGLRTELQNIGIDVSLFYQTQFQQNLRGGLDTHNGHRLSGSYDLQPDFDFEKMGLIKGGSFYMQVKGTWGNGVNPTKVGALFNPNDDADGDRAVFINKYWYKQLFWDKKIEVRVGVLQSNKDLFDVSPYAYHEDKDFLNLLSLRTPSVPHQTGIGAFLKLQPVDWLYFQAAAIDAEAGPRYEQNACSTAFHGRALYVGYWELGLRPKWQTPRGPMPGKYYVGWWYDSRAKEIFKDDLDGRRQPNFESGDVGSYLSFNQMVFKEKPDPEDVQGLGFFSRAGFAHRNVNRVARSWQVGLSYTGLCPTREKDVTAFSVAQGILSNRYRVQIHHAADRETVYELYHQFQVTPWCWITPDLQVITNPGGDKTDRDALVGGVRVRISF